VVVKEQFHANLKAQIRMHKGIFYPLSFQI